MKILYIADVKNWCFDHMGKALQKYGTNDYDIRYGRKTKYKKAFKGVEKYDFVLYPVDVRPDRVLKKNRVPREKLIMMIRCNIFELCKPKRLIYYENTEMMNSRVCAFMVANKYLYEKFKKMYGVPCYLAPGGVDTSVFYPLEGEWGKNCRVGWAGSKENFGKQVRGIPFIEEACELLEYEWKPAYREDKWRNHKQMAKYYRNDIDVFVDIYASPGRQNGLLEAGACGKALVTLRRGIGGDLIDAGAAIEVERTLVSVKEGINKAWFSRDKIAPKAIEVIHKDWSWEKHVKQWEEIFDDIAVKEGNFE